MSARIEFVDATAMLPEIGVAGGTRLVAIGFDPRRSVRIERGENAGAEIDYFNAVRSLADLGPWDGSAREVGLDVVAAGGRGLALIAQETATGRIVAIGRDAARGERT